MGKSEDGPENRATVPIPLETLGINQLKLSGTSFILRDLSKQYIYKVIKIHSATEALFYSIAYCIYVPNLDDLMVNNINPNTFKNLSYLVENKIIPYFYGLTSISYHDYSWYDLGQISSKTNGSYKAIKLENLLHGFSDPCVIDIKLGSHNDFNHVDCGDVDDSLKQKCVQCWREMKQKFRNSQTDQPVQYKFNLNASDLGLPESYNSLDTNELHSLLKTWRQKQVALETTEQELGFRISSIYFHNDDCKYVITSDQAKHLDKSQTFTILNHIFNESGRGDAIRLSMVTFLNRLKKWLALQTSISIVASSILIILDQNNLDQYKIKWIDFTHVKRCSIASHNEAKSNMIKGINNLISIVEGS